MFIFKRKPSLKHYFNKNIDSIEYIDDNEIKTMSRSQLLVFYSMSELIQDI